MNQTYANWRAHLVLDAPIDDSVAVAKQVISVAHLPVKLTVRKERMGLSYNMWHGIHEAKPEKEDIIAILDADDKLYTEALATVKERYDAKPDLLLTYGSYKKHSKGARTRISRAYRRGTKVRKAGWHASHLKTFKYKLFKRLPAEEMQYKDMWLPAASDVALMIPLIEMAGLRRCKHIHKMIYLWRDNTPQKTDRAKQIRCENIVRKKKPLRMRIV